MSFLEKKLENKYPGPFERAISLLRQTIKNEEVVIASSTPRLFFLCGANIREGVLSIRRKLLREFIEKSIENSVVVIAEHFFDNYVKNHRDKSDHKNSLDFEFVLTEISENVIIVLESQSSFCELGAFSHKTLRNKLLVINDIQYQQTPSFINTGPILALTEKYGDDRVLWYAMTGQVDEEDSIASIFMSLELSIGKNATKKGRSVDINPVKSPTTIEKTLFVHDIIFFYNPGSYKELIDILKKIFPEERSFDNIRHILAILTSLNFIDYNPAEKILRSCQSIAFLSYGKNENRISMGLKLSRLKEMMKAS